ncbi:diguanylate cyclase domain-containing protein [Streptomyces sp. NPDC014995]|uniref:diguanylate cyclase domain-containing protein n=1 Tax=Streptomyces sp. NPDC014995 TaxID=3364936 RepID=UPI0036FD9700
MVVSVLVNLIVGGCMIHGWAGSEGFLRIAGANRLRGAWVGKALCNVAGIAAVAVAGVVTAELVPVGIGVPAAHAAAALSFLARARTAPGRVRCRLTLFAGSVATGGVHHLLVSQFAPSQEHSAGVLPLLIRLLAGAGIAVCLAVAVTGLVLAAADNGTPLIWLRRLLDGWLVAGSLLTLAWVLLLHRAGEGGVSASVLSLARVVTDVLVLGLVVALGFCLNRDERTSTTVSALALVVLSAGDMLRILWPADGTWGGIPVPAACSMTGLLLITIAPWLPGGASLVRLDQRMMPVIGVVAAFVPVIVCALAMAAHTVAGGPVDLVLASLAGSVLLALGIRQGVTHADHLRITQEAEAREAHYRTLVDGTLDVITIVSLDGRVLYVSPAAYPVFGYRPEELVGARLPLYCHPDDLMTLMQAVQALRQEAESGTSSPGRRVACRVQTADGRWRHVESTISHHPQGMIFTSRDVSERVAQQAQLEHLAFHDALTGLPNRALFSNRVSHALRKRTATAIPPVVLFVDLDGFKAVNDSAGHATGDALLTHAARRLQASVRAADTVARLGGDEFAVLLEWEAGTDPSTAYEVAQRILSSLTKPYQLGSTEAVVSASIGMATALPGITPAELLHQADLAMYAAKAAGKGRIRRHHPQPPQRETPGQVSPTSRSCS